MLPYLVVFLFAILEGEVYYIAMCVAAACRPAMRAVRSAHSRLFTKQCVSRHVLRGYTHIADGRSQERQRRLWEFVSTTLATAIA